MRRAPPVGEFGRYPVVSLTIAMATIVSVLEWTGRDVAILEMDPHVGRGELWRLVTSALPHVNPFHLLFNVYWLWTFGTRVEGVFGRGRTAGLFLLLACVSGAAEYAVFGGGVGLSGVGYGLFGMLWVLERRDARFADAVDGRTALLFVAWFFLCIVTTIQGSMSVGNVAHGAGALTGAALGALVVSRGTRRVAVAAAVGVLAACTVLAATVGRRHVNLSPHRGDGEALLGHRALTRDRNEEAVRWLSESTALDPNDAGAWFNLGIAHHRLSRLREASDAYARAHRLRPDEPDFREAYEALRDAAAAE